MENQNTNKLSFLPLRKTYGDYDTSTYYTELINHTMKIARKITNQKPLHKNPNTTLLNQTIILHRDMTVYLKYITTVTSFIQFIYGFGADFKILINIQKGFKYQTNIVNAYKQLLKYTDIPQHYKKAIIYNNNKMRERISYIDKILNEHIEFTPLAEYKKTLPDNVTLIDDIWTHTDTDDDWNNIEIRHQILNNYFHYIATKVNINSENELREKYLKKRQEKTEKAKKEHAEDVLEKLMQKRDIADEVAAEHVKHIQRLWDSKDNREKTSVYKRITGIENPKIYVMISTGTILTNSRPTPKYYNKNMNITTSLASAKIFSDKDPMPEELKQAYENCKYGYAEILLT